MWTGSELARKRDGGAGIERARSIDLQRRGNLRPGFFEGRGAEPQGDSDAVEALLEVEARPAQQFGRLAEADLVPQVGAQNLAFRLCPILCSLCDGDGALAEGSEKAKVQGVEQDDLFSPEALDNGHFAVLNTVDDLLGIGRQVGLGDSGSSHGAASAPVL